MNWLEEIENKDLDEVEKTISLIHQRFLILKPSPPKSKDNVIKFSDYKQDVTNDGG